MKLVDILARELKEWPEGVAAIAQGGITCELYDSSFQLIEPGILVSPAEDRGNPEVMPGALRITRPEWQAAVDALKAEANPAESMALHHQEVGRITRQWNGEGLPPVGMVCEFNDGAGGEWKKVEIMYLSQYTILVKFDGSPNEDVEGAYSPEESTYFRPIRTPEQIASEERTNNAIAMCQATQGAHDWMEAFRMLHDAGYRKFEIVDN